MENAFVKKINKYGKCYLSRKIASRIFQDTPGKF